MKGGDWLQDVSSVIHKNVFISKMQDNPIKLHERVSLPNINYFY